jgi:aminoglycoside phosphotransferase
MRLERLFRSVADLNDWLNRRLALRSKTIDLTAHNLVLCHLDLCRRNIILQPNDQPLAVVD